MTCLCLNQSFNFSLASPPQGGPRRRVRTAIFLRRPRVSGRFQPGSGGNIYIYIYIYNFDFGPKRSWDDCSLVLFSRLGFVLNTSLVLCISNFRCERASPQTQFLLKLAVLALYVTQWCFRAVNRPSGPDFGRTATGEAPSRWPKAGRRPILVFSR